MRNDNATVYTALQADVTLAALIDDRVFWRTYKSTAACPQISTLQIDNAPAYYAVGVVECFDEPHFQIDIWCKETEANTTNYEQEAIAIAKAVNDVMEGLKYMRLMNTAMYEDDTQIFHRVLQYKKISAES